MKVFISWSGNRSKVMANALREWLPMVLQYVEPFVSDKDIAAGDRWAEKIATELESSNFGIICITPENINSEWMLFEAGALSKSMLEAKVIPILFGLELSVLSGPLKEFQAQKVDAAGIMKVVEAINAVSESKADENIIGRTVPALWPQLEKDLKKIPPKDPTEDHKKSTDEILEEIVTDLRGIKSRMRYHDPELSNTDSYIRRKSRIHASMIEEQVQAISLENDPIYLLLLAGLFREDYPWLSEILAEAYRELRSCVGIHESQVIFTRFGYSLQQLRFSLHNFVSDENSNEVQKILHTLIRVFSRMGHRGEE